MSVRVNSFFFFQAEDGIRDLYVTGVQTCALPISRTGALVNREEREQFETLLRVVLTGGAVEFEELIRKQRSEEHTSELQSRRALVCRLLLEKKKKKTKKTKKKNDRTTSVKE